jgi:hypothetical protein
VASLVLSGRIDPVDYPEVGEEQKAAIRAKQEAVAAMYRRHRERQREYLIGYKRKWRARRRRASFRQAIRTSTQNARWRAEQIEAIKREASEDLLALLNEQEKDDTPYVRRVKGDPFGMVSIDEPLNVDGDFTRGDLLAGGR